MSLKMITEPPGCETEELFVEKLNSLLPSDIRVWGFQRATNGFNART
jgi:tRNA U38,U39,U40 pseudouridine synthase TruA